MILLASVLLVALQGQQARVHITLERTACFGTCPVYSVTLSDDGTVSYDGRQFVSVPGRHAWHVEPSAVRALAADMEKAGFFDLQDLYRSPATDLSGTYTTLAIGTRSKRIKHYFDAPPKLLEFDARIEELSGVGRYVRGDKLDEALARGDAKTVTRLLAGGADARARDANGVTLVMKAAGSGDPDTVRAVLAAGGDPTARDLAGRNAADRVRDLLARDPGNAKLAAILRLLTDE